MSRFVRESNSPAGRLLFRTAIPRGRIACNRENGCGFSAAARKSQFKAQKIHRAARMRRTTLLEFLRIHLVVNVVGKAIYDPSQAHPLPRPVPLFTVGSRSRLAPQNTPSQ